MPSTNTQLAHSSKPTAAAASCPSVTQTLSAGSHFPRVTGSRSDCPPLHFSTPLHPALTTQRLRGADRQIPAFMERKMDEKHSSTIRGKGFIQSTEALFLCDPKLFLSWLKNGVEQYFCHGQCFNVTFFPVTFSS